MSLGWGLLRFSMAASVMELRMMHDDPSFDIPMSYKDALYLNMITMTPGCTASKLARMACVTKPTVTARINGMVSRGLVTRTRSEEDGRVFTIEPSELMVHAYERETEVLSDIEARLVERFGERRVSEFAEVLDEVSRLLSGAEAPDGPSRDGN